MSTLLNLLYLVAALLWLAVALSQTIRAAPPEWLHPNWPLRAFWLTERFRRINLLLLFLVSAVWVAMVVMGALEVDRPGMASVLVGLAVLLSVLGAAVLAYTTLLYRRPSAPEPDGF